MPTLPRPKARGLPGDLTKMMKVIVDDIVMVIDVFSTDSITDQQNPGLTQMSEFRVGDAIALGMQVQTHARAA